MSHVLKALADPTRRRILQLLREREMSAGEIASHFALSKPTLSGHFAVLKEAGLVEVQREGTTLIHRLNTSVLEDALTALMDGFGLNRARTPAPEPGETPE
jgi:ArsR family transcriptional regulator, arsenate/arsenite/antimonite-responsive transcriptional repressor